MSDLLFTQVKSIINDWDPAELLAIHCPEDEYHSEIKEICQYIRSDSCFTSDELGVFIHQLFQSYLGKEFTATQDQSLAVGVRITELASSK